MLDIFEPLRNPIKKIRERYAAHTHRRLQLEIELSNLRGAPIAKSELLAELDDWIEKTLARALEAICSRATPMASGGGQPVAKLFSPDGVRRSFTHDDVIALFAPQLKSSRARPWSRCKSLVGFQKPNVSRRPRHLRMRSARSTQEFRK